MRYNPIHRRRRLNSSRDVNAFIQEASGLYLMYGNHPDLCDDISNDFYYYCIYLINTAALLVDKWGCWCTPVHMNSAAPVMEIHEDGTDELLVEIPVENMIVFIVNQLANGYTPDTVKFNLAEWCLDAANAND